MGFFRKHQGRASYELFSNYSHYVPGYGGMMMLLLMFIIGGILGNVIIAGLSLISTEFTTIYGTVISYPVMFIPALLYASSQSRRNEFYETGYAVDSNNFGQLGGFKIALAVSVLTIAAAFIADSLNSLLPAMPEWLEAIMEQMMNGPLWISLLSVSVFAPLFEEWLCRGLILRGLLQKTSAGKAIVVSAAFFAIIHMNPWQALPAFLLGLLFGYVYYKTGSLKLTMLMHCVNNSLAVLLNKLPAFSEAESFMDVMSPWAYWAILAACFIYMAATLVILRNIRLNHDEAKSNCDEIPPMSI